MGGSKSISISCRISVIVVTSPYALHTETFSPNKHFIFNTYVS